MVGRPREFDPEKVLDAAMHAFWTKGYEATSLTDLMSATGLHKGSLYQAFGDKHELFVQALKRYLDDMRRQKNGILKNAATPLEGIHAVGHAMVEMADGDSNCPKGCMAVNALVELAPHDEEVERIMEDHINRMRASMEQAISAAQEMGQLSKSRSPEVTTSLMMTFLAGLAASLKSSVTKDQAHQLLDAQFEALL